jgi:4-hydroxy-2-oxoheptanedioate aldolase
MRASEFRDALRSGRRVYGTSILSASALWPPEVRRAGLDFVFLDTEHVPRDRETLSWMCRGYRGSGLPPLVRIPSPDPFEAAKVLDGGAAGVIAPYVESAGQVRALVGAVKLRPLKGERLAATLDDPQTLEPELKSYLEDRNANVVLVVNIESVPAMRNLDAILAVDGLDAVLIGPHDLSCSLGIPEQYRDPRFDEAVLEIIRKAREKGIGAGIHFSDGLDLEIRWAKAGANLILHSSDQRLFRETLERDIDEIRSALGDTAADFESKTDFIV